MDVLTHAIYEFLSLKVFYIVIGATTLVYVYIHSLRSKNTQLSHVKNNKSRSSCNSPNCVRCNKYREITTLAKTRFRDILSKHEVQNNKIKLSFDLFVDDKLRNSRACTDQNPEVYELGGLFARHWWNSIHFERTKIEDDLKVLMENFQIINEEYKSFIKNPSCINHFKLNDTERGKWSVCHLFNQGQEVKNNTEHFPETVHVLNSLSTAMLKNVFGNAVFSSLNPNTNIEEHYGPTDIRLRCHLGLVTPDCCSITVRGERRYWRAGECLLFDDSFLHSVAHAGDAATPDRVVLIVDLWHPDITYEERNIIDYVFAPVKST